MMAIANPEQLSEGGNVTCAVLLFVGAGVFMLWSGWNARREPENTEFWTDSTSVWLTKRLMGKAAAEEVEQRVHNESRIRQKGKELILIGALLVLSACAFVVLDTLGIL